MEGSKKSEQEPLKPIGSAELGLLLGLLAIILDALLYAATGDVDLATTVLMLFAVVIGVIVRLP